MTQPSEFFSDRFLLEETGPGQEIPLVKDILVDADVLVALAKTDDSNHKRAVEISNSLQQVGVTYYLSPFTAAEATTVLSYKVSQPAAQKFLREMREINLFVFPLSDGMISSADGWFHKQKKKGTAYFDCYNMALMERYTNQIEGIFSFDVIYKKNGFKMVGA